MVALLSCPTCRTSGLQLTTHEVEGSSIIGGELTCEGCDKLYPIRKGIPDLMPQGVMTSAEWKIWQQHLDKFETRINQREVEPDRLINTIGRHRSMMDAFAKFIGIDEGYVLDVGCGPGKFRFRFDESKVNYIGIDPIPYRELNDTKFVRGLGEYIPFKDRTFSHVVGLASLDHVKDVEGFFGQIHRVLEPDGLFHLIQSTHEVRGPVSAVKAFAHWVKDLIEDRIYRSDAPHHISEFTRSTLFNRLNGYFEVVASEAHSYTWYSPTNLFVTMRPKPLAADG